MTKKTLIIAILISLLGLIAFAKPEAATKQDKAQVSGPAKRMQLVDQWSNDLKAAYEAKDMDKIGKLIEQMDNFKARIREANAGKRQQDGEKRGKGERANKTKWFSKGNRQNDTQMQEPMNHQQDEQGWGKHQEQDGQQRWKRHHQQRQQDCDQQFAQGPGRGMRGQMTWQQDGQRQDRFDSSCCCGCNCGMQKGFARRGQGGMYSQHRQHWQGQGRGYQGQGFAGPMMGGPRHMGRQQWQGQKQWQGPMAMQGQGNFRRNHQMAGVFDGRQQGQCPMCQGQRGFDRPNDEQKSWGHGQFRGPQKEHQGRNRQRQNVTPSGNEWEW